MDISVKSYDKFSRPVNFGSKLLLQGKLEEGHEPVWKNVAAAFEKATENKQGYYILSEDDEYIRFSNVDRNYTTALFDKGKVYHGFGLWDKGFNNMVNSMVELADILTYESNISQILASIVDWNSKPRGLGFDEKKAQKIITKARKEAHEKSQQNIEVLLEKAPVFKDILVDVDLEPQRKK